MDCKYTENTHISKALWNTVSGSVVEAWTFLGNITNLRLVPGSSQGSTVNTFQVMEISLCSLSQCSPRKKLFLESKYGRDSESHNWQIQQLRKMSIQDLASLHVCPPSIHTVGFCLQTPNHCGDPNSHSSY